MKKIRRKSFLSGLLALVLMIQSVTVPALAVEDDSNSTATYNSWEELNEVIDETAVSGVDYTHSDKTLQIHTALGFVWFANSVNNKNYENGFQDYTVTLTSDINLEDVGVLNYTESGIAENGDNSWTPIGGSVTSVFIGTFDGNNHVVSGVYINNDDDYQGLFGRLSTSWYGSVTIKNLTISDANINGASYVSSLAGYVGINATVSNVNVKNSEITGSGYYVAGAIGYVCGASTISNVNVTDTTITGTNSMGGVVGYITTLENDDTEIDAFTTITECQSNATIISTESVKVNKVGGIIGYSNVSQASDDKEVDLLISNCVFSGEITKDSSRDYFADSGETGGIVGYVGRISAGGITQILSCYNTGTIEGFSHVGGIVGSASFVIIEQCYNTGSITANNLNSGGIVGQIGNSTITECYNTGTLTSEYTSVGGIVGDISGSTVVKLKNCYSIGEMKTKLLSVGCIIGTYTNTNEDTSITNCYYNTEIAAISGVNGLSGVGTYTDGIDISGIVGLTTLEMTGITDENDADNDTNRALDSMVGFNVDTWTFEADYTDVITTNSYYPVLTNNKQDPAPSTTMVGQATSWQEAASLAVSGIDYELVSTDDASTLKIYTSKGLAYFASIVNDNNADTTYSNYTVTLENDINLDDGTVTGYGKDNDGVIGKVNWIPIADGDSNKFGGTFDGLSHTISGIYINTDSVYQGLFGYISFATIQNVGIIDSSITGKINVGAIAGYAYDTEIINCYNSGSITGTYEQVTSVGGIVGYTNEDTLVTNCYNTGVISGVENVGGIVGAFANELSSVSNCYNTGTITGTTNSGGIAGYAVGSVTTCYNIGEAPNPIVGKLGANGGSVTDCYYDSAINENVTAIEGVAGLTTLEMTGDSGEDRAVTMMKGFDSDIWTFNDDDTDGTVTMTCYYPILTSNTQYPIPSNTANATTIENWEVVVASANKNDNKDYVLDTTEKTLEIYTVYGLAWFAAQVNEGTAYSGYTVTLMSDIDLTDANVVGYSAEGIAEDGTNSWTTIGIKNDRKYFKGIFEGNEHTISGVYINSSSDGQGLFGAIYSSAIIRNLTLSDSHISGTGMVGGMIGYADNATITNCITTSSVSVNGTNYCVGGIVGNASDVVIENCVNNATVTAVYSVGGIVGEMDDGSISGCDNNGVIEATASGGDGSNVGGIVGYIHHDTEITGCSNSETIVGIDKNVGGIVGFVAIYPDEDSYSATITSNINSGAVTGSAKVGGIVGYASNEAAYSFTISGNINAGDIKATIAQDSTSTGYSYVGGIVGYANKDVVLGTVTNDNTTISNTNTGDVTGYSNYVGGIAGHYTISKDTDFSMTGLENTGTITGTEYVGGLFGYIKSNVNDVTTIFKSSNSGEIKGFTYVGGILGYTDGLINISKSNNEADVTATGGYVGGLIGYSTNGTTISHSSNTGDITGELSFIGGLVGYSINGITITYSNNTGGITGDITGMSDYIGGISGRVISESKMAEISNCDNTGDIEGYKNIGGIVGDGKGVTIASSNNSGNISGAGNVGGVAGLLFESGNLDSLVYNSYNTGNITGNIITIDEEPLGTGGIVGIYGLSSDSSNEKHVWNCYNIGSVTGPTYVAGILGYVKDSNTAVVIKDCYNVGAITGTSDSQLTAAIATRENIGSVNDYINAINCYYNSDLSGVSQGITNDTADTTTDLTTAEMTGSSSLMNFSVNDDWLYHTNKGTDTMITYYYPTLKDNAQDPVPSTSRLVASITANMNGWTYGETANEPTSTVTKGDGTSVSYNYYSDANCETEISKPTNVGTYYVKATVAMTETYASAVSEAVEFSIAQVGLTNTTVTISGASDVTYTGSAFNPVVTVKYGETTLVKDTDYTLSYGTNTNAGTGKVIVSFKGNYSGEIEKTFEIEKAEITVTADSNLWNYYGQEGVEISYTYSGKVNNETPSFTGLLSRENGNDAGNYAITIGSLALVDNAETGFESDNYTLVLDETTVNYEVKAYEVNDIATATISANENGWYNVDSITLEAPNGYSISTSDDLSDNTWSQTLTITTTQKEDETVTYYLRATTGETKDAITTVKTFTYSNDQTAPIGTITIDTSTWDKFMEVITFGLYKSDDLQVTITSEDTLSGVNSTEYYIASEAMSLEQVKEITEWNTYENAFDIKVVDAKKVVIYTKITDEVGNVEYLSSQGVVFDTTAPSIIGVENLITYKTDLEIQVSDSNIDTITLNGSSVDSSITIKADSNKAYVLVATDLAGNTTSVVFYTYVDSIPVEDILNNFPSIEDATTEEEKEQIKEMVNNLTDDFIEELKTGTTKEEDTIAEETSRLEEALLEVNQQITVISSDKVVVDDIDDDKKAIEATITPQGLATAIYGSDLYNDNSDSNIVLSLSVTQTHGTEDGLVFNIKPMISINGGEAEMIDNSNLHAPITFNLYLNDSFKGSVASVEHVKEDGTSVFYENLPVYSDEQGNYVIVTVYEFSNFILREYTYDVSVDGEITAYKATTNITLTTPMKDGYEFVGWSSEEVEIVDGSFEMPEENVVIISTWKQILVEEDGVEDNTDDSATVAPGTGDSTNTMTWLLLAIGATLGMISLSVYKKKKVQ